MRKNQNEHGRSMVEILGVLAIIGVLSFGGIQGYKYAMDKHRANDIVQSVNMRATDIWHLYQDGEKELPDSPDADAFPEYGERTQTGFEILVTSHPPVAFRTWVNDVPSVVCQKVLQENLDEAIQGLKFVQVDNGGGLIRYEGDTVICGESGTNNQMVFTSFLDEDGGAVPEGGNVNPDNNALEHCVEEEDCTGGCNASCNERTMRCEDSCVGTENPICKETENGGVCVKCTQKSHCAQLGDNYTCSDLTNECVEVPAKCEEGKEFRTKNGICVACDNASNFMVGLDKFAVEELGIEDDLTGLEQCNACANPNTRYSGTVDEETAYCSYACTKGYSFQTTNSGCVSCTDTKPQYILNETVSKNQCVSCEGHEWYTEYWINWNGGISCQPKVECANDEFIYKADQNYWGCAKCSSSRNNSVYMGYMSQGNNSSSDTSFYSTRNAQCNACPEYDKNGNYSARYTIGGAQSHCFPVCEQPKNADEQVEICKANPKDERCTRKWQNSSGNCFSCDALENSSGSNINNSMLISNLGMVPEQLITLCENCGRVHSGNFCVLPQTKDDCGKGKFLGEDGYCHECSKVAGVKIVSEEISGCATNCENITDNKWYNGRRILSYIYNNQELHYCYRKPLDGIQSIQDARTGNFYACSDSGSYFLNHEGRTIISVLQTECAERCNQNGNIVRLAESDRCNIVKCPEVNGKKQFQQSWGLCRSCDSTSSETLGGTGKNYSTKEAYPDRTKERINVCENCGNRMFINVYYSNTYYPKCVFVNPGVSGVCNNINTELPSTLDDNLVEKSLQYMQSNTGLFRDLNGYCRSCTDKTSYDSSQVQCDICPNRRYNSNKCIYGLCEEKSQFLNASNSCVVCTSKNVAVDPSRENLCSSCENRRMLTTGFEEQDNLAGLCVEECAPGLWQGKNGTCYFANHEQTVEIGTDIDSRNLCTTAGREVVELLDGSGNVIGYACAL